MITENKIVFVQLTCKLFSNESFQSLMIEINCWLYLGVDYSVDSERTKTLVSVLDELWMG